MQPNEQVGVIPRTFAQQLGLLSHGFSPLIQAEQLDAVERHIAFADRAQAEDDPSQKQVIPYAVVCRGDQVFAVERLSGGGEARLHGKVSLGIGGHINPLDDTSMARGLIVATLARELDEELDAVGIAASCPVGFINDDTQPVGQVHLGVVYRIDLEADGRASVRELDSLRGGFLRWSRLEPLRRRMETWSAFVHDAYQQGLLG